MKDYSLLHFIITILSNLYQNKSTYIILYTFLFIKFIIYIKNKLPKTIKDLLLSIPLLKNKIKNKLIQSSNQLQTSMVEPYTNITQLAEKPKTYSEIEDIITEMKPSNYQEKNISGIIYLGDQQHNDNMVKIFSRFSFSNPLHPDIFPEIRQMEIDIINIAINLFQGNENCCGNITYGGTESILLACLTYRDYYQYHRNIDNPNIICYDTVHPAFDKACHYFGIKQYKISKPQNIHKYIDNNTILLVGSCPEYSYGTIDPILELSNIALQYNLGLHIDCCMGGFLIPFLEEFNYINFSLDGITSISLDTHKYGYSLKGSSILLFRNYQLKKFQHYINKNWKGGVYATPTLMGSKSGSIIASTWCSLLMIGKQQYTDYAIEIQQNLLYIKNETISIDDLYIIGEPKLNIIAYASNTINIYLVIKQMKERNWELTIMQNPPSFHLCITKTHTREVCTKFCQDLKDSVEIVKQNENQTLDGTLALYGSSEQIENSLFIDEIIHDYIFLLSSNNCSHRYKQL